MTILLLFREWYINKGFNKMETWLTGILIFGSFIAGVIHHVMTHKPDNTQYYPSRDSRGNDSYYFYGENGFYDGDGGD